jgi:hypothetical protein
MNKSSTHRTGVRVYLRFTISQHSRDEALLKSLINFLGTGRYQSSSSRASGELVVNKFPDIINIIIPLFTKYPILGIKGKDFEDFCLVSDLMSKGAHLEEQGLAKIKEIKARMNTGRNLE